jgi:hypothetical protein
MLQRKCVHVWKCSIEPCYGRLDNVIQADRIMMRKVKLVQYFLGMFGFGGAIISPTNKPIISLFLYKYEGL